MSEEDEGDMFSSDRVKELNNEDFALESTEGLTLFAEGCSLLLFYNNQPKSAMLADIWKDLSEELTDVNFYGVNLSQRRDISRRIGQIRNDANHIFNKFTLAKAPYIIVYRESLDPKVSYPQAFYNGSLETQAIANWIADLACQPGYTNYISDTYDDEVDVNRNSVIDEDVDDEGNPTPILTKQYNDQGLKRTQVDRILASREREIKALSMSPRDYDLVASNRQVNFKPNKRVSSARGVGHVKF